MSRKLNLGLVGVFVILLSTLLIAGSVSAAEHTLKFSNNVSADHSWGRAAEKFASYVEDLSNGEIEIQVSHGGALGSTRETLEMSKRGDLGFAIGGTSYYTAFVPEMGITILPYLWQDRETMFEILDGGLGDYLAEKLEAKGFHLIGFWDNGFRHITTNKQINSVDDMKGLKIRTLPVEAHKAFFRAVGAAPTPIDWTELFEALRMGTVDAQENPPAMVYTAKFQEVQDYYTLSGHVNEPGCVVMSQDKYESLPDDLQMAIDLAASRATDWQREANYADNQKYLDMLKDAGMTVKELPDDVEKEFRRVAREEIYPEFADKYGGQEILDMFVWANQHT